MNFRIQKVNWHWWAITKLLTVNEQVIFFLRNWYWRPASHFVTANKVVELYAVFQRPTVCHAEMLENTFCFERIFCGLSALPEIWKTNNTKVKLTCVVNYPPRPDHILKCEVITESVLSRIIIRKNANHQAQVKTSKFLRNRSRLPPCRMLCWSQGLRVSGRGEDNLRHYLIESRLSGNSFLN